MKRPLLWAFGASILGEILAYQNPEAGVAWAAAGVGLSALLIWGIRQRGRRLLLPVFFLVGFVGMLRADTSSPLRLFLEESAAAPEGEVSGRVKDIRRSENGFRIWLTEVCFYPAEGEGAEEGIEGEGLLFYTEEYPEMEPGDRVWAEGTCQACEAASNSGQFDSRLYYRALYIEGIFFPQRLSVTAFGAESPEKFLYRLRMSASFVLEEIGELGSSAAWEDTMGLLSGILLGEKSRIPEEVSKALSAGGLSHMAAVSGLHISLIGMSLFRFLKKRAALSYPASVAGSLLPVILYGSMVGKTASSVRAIVSFAVLLGGELLDESYDLPSASSAAGLFLLIRSPWLLFQAGFQLSFLAAAGIGLIYPVLREYFRPGPSENAFLFGLSVQIATLPAVASGFYEYSSVGLFLNLIAVPLLPAVVGAGMAGLLLGLVSVKGGALFLFPVHILLRGFCLAGEWASKLPGGRIRTGCPSGAGILGFALLWLTVLFLLQRRKKEAKNPAKFRRVRVLLIFLLAASLLFLRRPVSGKLTIVCLDVGQGDCTFLRFPSGSVMLIDGGSSDVREVGTYRILPFLKYMGVSRIDYLAVTHMDEDHKNGLEELLAGEEVRVDEILLSGADGGEEEERLRWREAGRKQGILVEELSAGMRLSDESGLEILCCAPPSGTRVEEENDASLVFLLTYQDFRALFTGDLGEKEEHRLPAFLRGRPLDFLKVAHHGSRYSTGEAFLEAARPERALISCGENNRYGHPHEELLARLSQTGCEVRITAKEGAFYLTTDGVQVRAETFGKGREKQNGGDGKKAGRP